MERFFVFAGVVLMALCGSIIGRNIGYEGFEQAYMAGFAIGVILLAQAPVIGLRKRVRELESQMAEQVKNIA